jgi:Mg2+ and Co2+ transporter CorA
MKSVYDLAMLITSRCSGMFDRHRLDNVEYQFLDMFESSIGQVTNKETELFDYFNRASSAAGKWLEKHRLPRSLSLLQEIGTRDPKFQDALLDIGIETRLLAEIKDIRDELNMIRMVLTFQHQKLPDFADHLVDELGKKSDEAWEIRMRSKEQLKIVKMHLDDVDRMDKQADSIHQSLLSLLDLKQKHANAFEARFGRDQAAFSARSSKTILVFTIVTIIFLPLSFIAAFFAINIREFPHGPDGPSLPLGYVSRYIFGIGLTISLPLIALAFAVDDVAIIFPKIMARIRNRKKREENDPSGEREEETEKPRTQFIGGAREIIDNMARKSFGFERELSPAQRPHSRTTQISWARRSHEVGRIGFSNDLERGRDV